MKTAKRVQQTSIESYLSIYDLKPRQSQVYRALVDMTVACNQELAERLGLPINQVTGRTMELREKGLVKEAYRDLWQPTNRTVIFWCAV